MYKPVGKDYRATAIRKIIIGSIIAEQGALQLVDSSFMNLKANVNKLRKTAIVIQEWFLKHPKTTETKKKLFTDIIYGNDVVLYGELLETVWGLSESDLEEIIRAIQANVDIANAEQIPV
jgi:hypothetical protein